MFGKKKARERDLAFAREWRKGDLQLAREMAEQLTGERKQKALERIAEAEKRLER